MLENAGNFAAQSENPNVWKQYAWPGDDCPHFYGLNLSSLFYTRFLEITETVGEGNPWSHRCPSPLPPPGSLSISACRNIQKEGSITYMLQYVGKQRWIERRIGSNDSEIEVGSTAEMPVEIQCETIYWVTRSIYVQLKSTRKPGR